MSLGFQGGASDDALSPRSASSPLWASCGVRMFGSFSEVPSFFRFPGASIEGLFVWVFLLLLLLLLLLILMAVSLLVPINLFDGP